MRKNLILLFPAYPLIINPESRHAAHPSQKEACEGQAADRLPAIPDKPALLSRKPGRSRFFPSGR
jgi:hypothetical protein